MPGPVPIVWPQSSFPGSNPQESQGRLINAYMEPVGEGKDTILKWIRSAGLSLFAATAKSGYRGGLAVAGNSYEVWENDASTVNLNGAVTDIGNFPGTQNVSIARNQASPSPDVVAVDLDNGAYVLGSATVLNATATATIGGGTYTSGDIIALTFLNPFIATDPISVSYTLGAGESPTTIATALKNLINANSGLSAQNLTATSAAGVLTIIQKGSIGNNTSVVAGITTGTETVTFVPASGNLTGGQGTFGAFSGIPTAYNGFGVLPQPNSVCFQDGYFFFTCANNQIFATALNSLSMNALTEVFVESKSDVTLQRGVAFQGLLLAFTTGSCEVWQDAANPAPNFPYSRQAVLEIGLIQTTAIAGWDTGFSELLWVGQDFGVHWMTPGGLGQVKVSPPDLDRLIEAEARAGNALEAGCDIVGGKKFWTLSSPNWTWEFNLQTRKWCERQSLNSSGLFGRWRARGGHPAFGKWLVGDEQSGNLLFVDDTNPTDAGTFMLWRMESAPTNKFPAQQRIAGADFNFVVGVGQAVGSVATTVVGAAAAADGGIELVVRSTSRMQDDDVASVASVTGTTEAIGNWPITVIDATHLELQGSRFVDDYISGGTVIDLTSPPNAVNPSVAISMSKDGGVSWGNPLIRSLGAQQQALRTVVTVNNMGLSGRMGVRWRVDVTDPVYVSFFGGSMSSEIRYSRL